MRKKLFLLTIIINCTFLIFTACGNETNNTEKTESKTQSESGMAIGDSENEESDAATEDLEKETNAAPDREYPHDAITLDFTCDHPYNPIEFPNLESKGTMSEDEIDRVFEGTADMLLQYSEHNDKDMKSNDYNGIMQEYYTDPGENTAIIHVCIWDDDLLDEVMQGVGYSTYEVNYYYPQGIWKPPYESIARPVYVSLYIDGNGYEYYFADNQLVSRNAGDGISYNPTVNDFIKDIYKIGCYYGNNMVGERKHSLDSDFDPNEFEPADDTEFEGDDFIPDASLSDKEAAIQAIRWYGYDAEYYISLGMEALINGTVDVDGAKCILVEFGTDTAEKFTSEYQFAYNRANNAVYKYDVAMDEWERCK